MPSSTGSNASTHADNFPALWDRIDDLVDAGRLIISEEVWHEVEAKTMTAKVWSSSWLDRIIVPTDGAITAAVQQLLADHPRLVMNMKGRNRADPFVIALARTRGATVVTGEVPTSQIADRRSRTSAG